ncbi:MAG: bifunctional 5,10-methylenetetrahydrofolate dehydrogenase/5,10-methenyltetrahydrofolate cyclohydrolase [Terriglobales bacterium]
MPARILDGEAIAQSIRAEVRAQLKSMQGVRPGVAVVLVGNDPASEIYVRGKLRSCEEMGLHAETHRPAQSVTTEQLLWLVDQLNHRDDIDGILVQLPLPPQVDTMRVLLAVDPVKDVDGFHPLNFGLLSKNQPAMIQCTAAGIMEILERSDIPIDGAEAVVVGRSEIVGRPTAMMLLNRNATVTVCHSHTRDLAGHCRRADILISAVGKPGFIDVNYVKEGATVIDVGINRITDRTTFDKFFKGNARREKSFAEKGSTLIGDVHPEVAVIAGAITPVPGGVGPLTVAMLLVNLLKACRIRRGKELGVSS